ncbi:hypothetical protein JCM24511_08955 [Saitozyma sp. JCM 24511]|nr:hypothetical protein JCM24511_08955 [Saitozyma sp. JCM 24511]
MKIVTAEEAAAHRAATTKGAMRGGAFGVGIIAPSHFLLQRKAFYRSIPITLKTLAYVCLLVPCVSIGGEKAGEAFERSRWTGVAARELERGKAKEETKWETLNTGGKVKEWAKTNKWGLIAARLVMEGGLQGGGYQLVDNGGSSMGLAFALVARSPQTFSQKVSLEAGFPSCLSSDLAQLVQARMWAQGLTVGTLVSSALLAGVTSKNKVIKPRADHSWIDMLEQEGELSRRDITALHRAADNAGGHS